MIEVAKATVTIIPNMEGAQKQIASDLGAAADEAGSKAGEKSGSSFMSGFGKAAAAGGAVIAGVTAAAVSAGKSFVDAAKQTAQYGDEVDKMSQKLGLSAEAYQEWDYVLNLAGTEMSSMSTGLKTLTNKLADAAAGGEDSMAAFEQLGISMDDISTMSREDLFEKAIYGFQQMEDSTERAALANKLFGKSGQELTPLFNQTTEATKAQIQEARQYGMVLSKDAVAASAGFVDSLTKLGNTTEGLKNRFLSEMLPGLTDITDGFSDLFAGVDGGSDKMKKGITSILTALKSNLPMVLRVLSDVVVSVVGILPDLVSQILTELPGLFSQIFDAVVVLIKGLLNEEMIGTLLDTVLGIIISLINNLDSILIPIIQAIPVIIVTVIEKLLENLPALISGIIQLVLGIVSAIPDITKYLLDHIPEIIGMVISALKECIPELIVGIAQLVAGVFSAAGEILAAVWEFLGNAAVSVGKWFGNLWSEYIAPWFANLFSNIGNWFAGIWTKIGEFFSGAISSIWTGLQNVWLKISDWFIQTWTNLGKWLSNFWTKIGDWFKSLPSKLSGAFQAIWKWLGDRWNDFVSWGGNLVSGIWQGISNGFNWIKEKIAGWVGGVMDWFKKLFGIASPSKLFRDEIGVYLAKGLGEGFEDEMKDVAKDMTDAVPTSFDAEVNGALEAGRSIGRHALGDGSAAAYSGLTINMTVNGAEGQNVELLADIIMDKIQRATERKQVAYV